MSRAHAVHRKLLILFAAALFANASYAQTITPCPGGDGGGPYFLERDGLNWCDSNSSGFNEGALCGVNALGGVGLNLPIGSYEILGNTWSRTNMMGAAKSAARSGFINQAVEAAVCCQVQNNHMHSCLQNNRNAVRDWLLSH
jgi:hypothetical protein